MGITYNRFWTQRETVLKGMNAKSEILKRKRKVEGRGRGRERKRKGKKEEGKGWKGNWKWSFGRNGKNRKRPSRESNSGPQQTRLMLYHWATETSDITSWFVRNFEQPSWWCRLSQWLNDRASAAFAGETVFFFAWQLHTVFPWLNSPGGYFLTQCFEREVQEGEFFRRGNIFNFCHIFTLPERNSFQTVAKKFVPSLGGVVFLHIDHVQN